MRSLFYQSSLIALLLFTFTTQLFAKDADNKEFSQAQLDQIMAPIALYPDALLSQVLMASTYPTQVSDAAKWSKKNEAKKDKQIKGDDAVTAVEDKNWDPSVASLVAFPQVLDMMDNKPDWVKEMGDTFLADSEKTMDTIQTLRKKAKAQGNLESTDEQTVTTDDADIIIASTSPEIIYVPAYNPTIVYGTWWYPMYPPYYYPPPPRYGFGAGFVVGFGVGIIVHNSVWGGVNWHHGSVNINVNRYNNIYVNNKITSNNKNVDWSNHNRNKTNAANKQAIGKNNSHKNLSGKDQQRQKALNTMKDKGINPASERKKLNGASGDKIRNNVTQINKQPKKNFSTRDTSKAKNLNNNRTLKNNQGSGMNRTNQDMNKMNQQRNKQPTNRNLGNHGMGDGARGMNGGMGGGGRNFGGGGRR